MSGSTATLVNTLPNISCSFTYLAQIIPDFLFFWQTQTISDLRACIFLFEPSDGKDSNGQKGVFLFDTHEGEKEHYMIIAGEEKGTPLII